MNDKSMPQRIDAEQAILGSMFLSDRALQKIVESVNKDMFYLDSHKKIFETIKNLYDRNSPIDMTTVTAELERKKLLNQVGGVEYLSEVLDSVPTAANAEYYIKLVEDAAILRRLIDVSTDITTNAYQSDGNVNETLDEAERKILSIIKNRRSTEFRTIKEVLDSTHANLEKLAATKGEITGIPTGWYDIDNLTTGLQGNQTHG